MEGFIILFIATVFLYLRILFGMSISSKLIMYIQDVEMNLLFLIFFLIYANYAMH